MSDVSDQVVKNFWDLDAIGITSEECLKSPVLETFNEKIVYDGGRYMVPLLWKPESNRPQLVDNKSIALRRLNNLTNRLDHDPSLEERYTAVLNELEESGVVEEVVKDKVPFPVYYLPHQPVLKEASTSTKV